MNKPILESNFESKSYEYLIPDCLLDRNIKIQILNSLTEDFYLQKDTEFVVIDLPINVHWYDKCKYLNFLADFPKWACIKPIFDQACQKICPEMKNVYVYMKLDKNGYHVLEYDTRSLNNINNRSQIRYPWMRFKWEKNSFVTILPAYFFTPKQKSKRKFTILNNN
jgi:hypothetical protein